MDAVGEVELLINSIDKNGVPTSISVRNALVIPDFRTNLLSEPQLMASAARGTRSQPPVYFPHRGRAASDSGNRRGPAPT